MSKRPPGLAIGDCRRLTVTATFAGAVTVSLDSYWPALLDGLLAGVERGRDSHRPTETVPLPLGWYARDCGQQWNWLASVAAPVGLVATRAAGWNSRWERGPDPEAVTCTGLEWRAVGDAAGVGELLSRVRRVGNRQHGATVERWGVIDSGEPSWEWAIWLPSGHVARPVAARAASGLGVPDAETVDGAVRPPYWRPPPVTEGGTFGREWRPVIAPWTWRPDARAATPPAPTGS